MCYCEQENVHFQRTQPQCNIFLSVNRTQSTRKAHVDLLACLFHSLVYILAYHCLLYFIIIIIISRPNHSLATIQTSNAVGVEAVGLESPSIDLLSFTRRWAGLCHKDNLQ